MPFYAILCHFIPFYSILFHFMPFYAILCHFMPFYAILCHFMPFYAILCQYWCKFLRSRPWIGLILGQILSILGIIPVLTYISAKKVFFFRLQSELYSVKFAIFIPILVQIRHILTYAMPILAIIVPKFRICSRTLSYQTFNANIDVYL